MTNHRFIRTAPNELTGLKQRYLRQLAAPLDGMWECFVTLADHYSIICGDEVVGYCVINSEQRLLQFYVAGARDAGRIFSRVLTELKVTGAFLSTGDGQYLSNCLDHQKSVAVNALLYHVEKDYEIKKAVFPAQSHFRPVKINELEATLDFGVQTLGADPDWLKAYFSERIAGGELFGLWQGNQLMATGECRPSRTQKPCADLGMVVAENHRGKGLATNILRYLLQYCRENGLTAICSTGHDNLAARKTIEKSGFICHHRILEILF